MKKNTSFCHEPIAIIGAACRFPGNVSSPEDFWSLLKNGTDAVTEIPPGRFSLDRFYSANRSLAGRSFTLAAGVLAQIKEFDPDFFGISRKEAMDMDPQQRLALETAYEAMEHACVCPSSLRGSNTGVYMGASNIDNSLQAPDDPAVTTPYSMTGSNLSIIANRVSYVFDLHGPSLTVDTACSSSLVALHLACEDLRSGLISQAIAGGVNILLAPYAFVGFSKARMLSPDGRCKVFDASGNGYVRSEGGGALLLKTLSAALADGNNILGLIAATGMNSDGRTTGIALPNGDAQAALLEDIYSRFKLDKDKVAYVEAHGTGTAAGDPIEAASIGNVIGKELKGKRTLHVGSVKGNIGHLESASGIAGLIKALLVLQHGEIPPNLHFSTPNPAIDFKALNIAVPVRNTKLPKLGGGELISVNSFGFGGTNAHVVLQRFQPEKSKRLPVKRGDSPLTYFLSAKSIPSLQALASQYAGCLEGCSSAEAYDLAATIAFDRDDLPIRAVVTSGTATEAFSRLKDFAQEEHPEKLLPVTPEYSQTGKGIFAFSGNGSQWCGMGHRLIKANPIFLSSLEEIDSLLAPLQGWSIMDVFHNPERHASIFQLTEKAQPLLFAVQVALVKALEHKGLYPAGVLGHSLGEVAAAWTCGALSLEDAVSVIYHRSILQGPLRGTGVMAVANISEHAAKELLSDFDESIEITAVNTDSSVTFAGSENIVRAFLAECKRRRIAGKMLDIPYPFHTKAMEGLKDLLFASLSHIKARKPKIPFYSTATGKLITSAPDVNYWYTNMRMPVLFAQAVKHAYSDGFRRFLEIGASPVLRSYMRDIFRNEREPVAIFPTLFHNEKEPEDFDAAWGNAWKSGWELDRKKHFPYAYARTTLPPYPWNREYLWSEDTPENFGALKKERQHPLLGWSLHSKAPVFENTLCPADYPWLADHVAGNGIVYPAAAFLESMLAAAHSLYPDNQLELERVAILRPLSLSDSAAKVVRLTVDKEDGGLRIEARMHMSKEPWGTYARARIVPIGETPADPGMFFGSPDSFGMSVDKENLYKTASRFLLHYGPAFQTVQRAWISPDVTFPEVLAEFTQPDDKSAEGMLIPPTLLDGAMQTLFILLGAQRKGETKAFLPVAFERVILFAPGRPRYVHTRLERMSPRSVVASFKLLDNAGNTLLLLKKCRFRRAMWLEHENTASRPYTIDLTPLPHPDEILPFTGTTPAELARTAEQAIQDTEDKVEVDAGSAVHPYLLLQLASLSSAHETVLSLCGTPSQGFQCSSRELMQMENLSPSQETWFNAMLERLEYGNLAARANDVWQIQPRGERVSADMLWRTIMSASSGYLPEASLLAHVFRRRSKILSGSDEQANDKITSRLIQNYFTNSASLQPFSTAARRCVETILRSGKKAPLLNFLQIAKNPVDFLPELQPLLDMRPCRYVVAEKDASSAEAHNQQFTPSPSLSFEVLNPEEPTPAHLGKYHCILLAWSLHEYLNNAKVIESCREMLAPGGILCILEHVPSIFADYVFGSQPSWWSASEDGENPVSLLQAPSYWRDCLSRAGFTDITVTGREDDAYRPAFLLLARKDTSTDSAERTSSSEPEHCIPLDSAAGVENEKLPDEEYRLIVTGDAGTPGSDLAEKLAEALSRNGLSAVLAQAGKTARTGEAATEGWWTDMLAFHARAAGKRNMHVLFTAGYDTRQDSNLATLDAIQIEGSTALTELIKAKDALRMNFSLWIFTGGGLNEMPDARPVPSQGVLTGFARVLKNEARNLELRLIDIHGDPKEAEGMLPQIVREILHPTDEPEIVFCGKTRHVSRLVKLLPRCDAQFDVDNPTATLSFDHPGRLQNLYWKSMLMPEPKADEVCIEVKYTGLNFRDVMWCMGMLPDEALENGFSGPNMGIECSGIIRAVGSGVKNWKPGDEVLCFTPAGFSTTVVTKASAIARKPANISFAEGATIPVAFMTAWYSLKHLARMQPGESILIHGAAGGVGLAAIQIATYLGLTIHATAGSAEKHSFLRQLGVKNIYSSRSLAFAEEILERTNGQGVDAVLNSLAGEAIPAGLSVLRPFGRFLELGKRDFFADTPMRLRPFSNNISYFGIDVDQLHVHQPALAQSLFSDLMELFAKRKLVPLPYTAFPASRTVTAFQTMQQSAHIGKIVVSMSGAAETAKCPAPVLSKLKLRDDATYLVTGGTGGLGLASAVRLARRGAKHLLLLSRRGVTDAEAAQKIDHLRSSGVQVVVAKVDVAEARQLEECLNRFLSELPPLRGIIHAAAVLDDGLITGLTEERIRASLAAKSLGAYNLHTFSQKQPLDFFMLYSSAAAPFGNPGQAPYVGANNMLEALAARRLSLGLPAQYIGWGPIDDTGMLTRNPKARELLLKVLGISPTPSNDALYWLEHCIAQKIPGSYYFGIDWQSRAELSALSSPRFSKLRPQTVTTRTSEGPGIDHIRSLPPKEGIDAIADILVEEISHVLRLPKDRFTANTSLISQGMDSLMAVELALAIEQKFELTGYNLALSEKTTAISLAESLYTFITGSAKDATSTTVDPEKQMLQALEQKHGFLLSEQERVSVVKSMKEDTHGKP